MEPRALSSALLQGSVAHRLLTAITQGQSVHNVSEHGVKPDCLVSPLQDQAVPPAPELFGATQHAQASPACARQAAFFKQAPSKPHPAWIRPAALWLSVQEGMEPGPQLPRSSSPGKQLPPLRAI